MSLTDADKLQEVVVSYLPLSHIAAQMLDIWLPMKAGGVAYFAQPDALKVPLYNAYTLINYSYIYQRVLKRIPSSRKILCSTELVVIYYFS